METNKIKEKISKLEGKKIEIEDKIEKLQNQLPHEVKTRGDPVVEFI